MSEFRDPFNASTPFIDDNDSSLESDDSDVPTVSFPGHRDTLALLQLKKHQVLATYTAVSLPSELLLQIYQHLNPLDFHAARHTCKKWFLASLDKTLLQTMSRRAGCSQAADEDSHGLLMRDRLRRLSVECRRSLEHADYHIRDCHSFGIETSISDEWLLSKRLATEAHITPGRHVEGAFMTVRDVLDFKTLLPQTPSNTAELSIIKNFTVSSCGKFLLVSFGHNIHVYVLWPAITPITSLCCHREVLAASMDTSSNRYSVAVLLEERIGMCWDLDIGAEQSTESNTFPFGMQAEVYTSDRPGVPTSRASLPIRRAEHVEIKAASVTFENTGVPLEAGQTAAVYEQLGSPDDPPRSVAICPQRKCVAFGCGTGIELHWVDALTGGDLNRWFPLAASSDFLYFLPQRPGLDSTKKLRLISSAGGPALDLQRRFDASAGPDNGEPAKDRNVRSTSQCPEPERHQSMARLFFGSLPFPSVTTSIVPSMWPTSQGVLRTLDCDHYRAIPLSDGFHVLFTDPTSGLLCLGSDAPLGSPTKLIRKFVFLPPGYISTTTKLLPTCYSAAHNLQWGVRVAATYADGSLVLFNIPSDCFNHVKQVRNTPDTWDEHAGVITQSDLLMDVMMDVQRASERLTADSLEAEVHSQTHTHGTPLRTIQVPGVKITNLEYGIDDIAVMCQEGGIRIWTFQSNGHAQYWDILSTRSDDIPVRRVTSHGLIEEIGKGRARDATKGIHVHFGGIDGSKDSPQQAGPKQTHTVMDPRQIAGSFVENIQRRHYSFSIGKHPHKFWKDFQCDDELLSCLAYRRIVFEEMGSQRGSVSTMDSSNTRRKSDG